MTRVLQHEASSAVGVLREAGLNATLTKQGRLLISGDAGERNSSRPLNRSHFAINLRCDERTRASSRLGPENRSRSSRSRIAGVNIEEHGARGIASIGGVDLTACEAPEQPAVDGPESKLAGLRLRRALPETFSNIQGFWWRRNRVNAATRVAAGSGGRDLHFGAARRMSSPAILPNDRIVDRSLRSRDSITIAVSRWLAMPMAATSLTLAPALAQLRLPPRSDSMRSARVVLDPSGLRKDLIEFALGNGANCAALIE